MSNKEIKLALEGIEAETGNIDLQVFLEELIAFRKTLECVDKIVREDQPGTKFMVSNLSHSSPAMISVQPVPRDIKHDQTDQVIEKFVETVNFVRGGMVSESKKDVNFPRDEDFLILDNLHKVSEPVGERLSSATVFINNQKYNLDSTFRENLKAFLASDESCFGSIEGALEQINLHGKKQHFTIYPEIGAKQIKCIFPKELHDIAVSSLEKKVLVSGELHYRPRSLFPHEIVVDNIEPLPDDKDLPSFDDLLGILPRADDDRPSEEIIREIRDEWD